MKFQTAYLTAIGINIYNLKELGIDISREFVHFTNDEYLLVKLLHKIDPLCVRSIELHEVDCSILPDNLTVKGKLDLYYSRINVMPENLTITGHLYLNHSKIIVLPDHLTIGGGMDISDTKITSLPDSLSINGKIFTRANQLKTIQPKFINKILH